MILKATDRKFAKHQISECVRVWLRVNIHTCTDSFTGQPFLLSLFVSVNSVSTRGWFGFRDSGGMEFLFTRWHFHIHKTSTKTS